MVNFTICHLRNYTYHREFRQYDDSLFSLQGGELLRQHTDGKSLLRFSPFSVKLRYPGSTEKIITYQPFFPMYIPSPPLKPIPLLFLEIATAR